VADTDSESGAETSNVENEFEEEEMEQQQQQQQQQASAQVEPQAATSDTLPTWRLPQGMNTNIQPFVDPAKDSSPLSVLMFFKVLFYLLVEQTNVYYQQHLDGQAGPSH
jgi:hypothetical protein